MSTLIQQLPALALGSLKNIDRVVLFLILSLLVLFAADSHQAADSVRFTLDAALYILPFLLLAVALAASIKATGADQMVVRALSGSPVKSVMIAAVFGALSPFCSCGVIPLIAAMLAAGVPLAPVMTFWIASPVMDPEMFVLTSAGISFEFAAAKAGFAIMIGLMAGFSILLIKRMGGLSNPLKPQVAAGCVSTCSANKEQSIVWAFWRSAERLELFKRESIQTALFLGKWLLLAFFLESLMVAYIDPEWIQRYLSGESWLTIPLASVIGMPSYLNGYAAIPLIGEMMSLGMSSGAAMAFMIAGAVSSIPAAIAVYSLVNMRVFVLYLALGLVGSILAGVLFASMT
ncbi:MAG: permease [Pseudomonadota bacterium]